MRKRQADAPSSETLFPGDGLLVCDAITVTGSRDIAVASAAHAIAIGLKSYVGEGRTWLIGGALGIDQLATDWLLAKDERVVAVVPFTVADQPSSVQDTLQRVGRRIELQYKKTKHAYLMRNAYMVERSETVVAFWNGDKGGTWATIQQSLKLHKQLHVYPVRSGHGVV